MLLNHTCVVEGPGAFLRVFSPREHRHRHSGGRGRLVTRVRPVCSLPAWPPRPLGHPVSGSLARLFDVRRILCGGLACLSSLPRWHVSAASLAGECATVSTHFVCPLTLAWTRGCVHCWGSHECAFGNTRAQVPTCVRSRGHLPGRGLLCGTVPLCLAAPWATFCFPLGPSAALFSLSVYSVVLFVSSDWQIVLRLLDVTTDARSAGPAHAHPPRSPWPLSPRADKPGSCGRAGKNLPMKQTQEAAGARVSGSGARGRPHC